MIELPGDNNSDVNCIASQPQALDDIEDWRARTDRKSRKQRAIELRAKAQRLGDEDSARFDNCEFSTLEQQREYLQALLRAVRYSIGVPEGQSIIAYAEMLDHKLHPEEWDRAAGCPPSKDALAPLSTDAG